jgi:predicted RNA binding protein YcfA (HicA-like mRNA interferase family)
MPVLLGFAQCLNQALGIYLVSNIAFDDIRGLLIFLGFDERIRGSHHLYRKQGINEKINIQRAGNKEKPYQVKQIREVILKYHLTGE